MATRQQHDKPDASALFYALAEDLKTPLLRIAYTAELASQKNQHASDIQHAAQTTLQLLDAYLLGVKGTSQTALELAPVNPSAIVSDVAYSLSDVAKKFSCELLLDVQHTSAYALTHRQALQAAMTAVGRVFIEAQHTITSKRKAITLAAYKTKSGIRIGVFSEGMEELINSELLAKARTYVGSAARPFAGLASGAATQLFIAEQLATALDTTMRSAKHGNISGLAFEVPQTAQLKLV